MTERTADWWCPKPWTTEAVAIDWRSAGRFTLTMHGPGGEAHQGDGMLLEVVVKEMAHA